jgi:hypothetical protein
LLTANHNFDFRTLFIPVQWKWEAIQEAVSATVGAVKWSSKKKGTAVLSDGRRLSLDVSAHTKGGDLVARTTLGAATFLRDVRVPAAQKRSIEQVVMRIFDSAWMIGCTTDAQQFTEEAAGTVQALQLKLLAVSFSGWAFEDHRGRRIVDIKKKVALPPAPAYYVLGFGSAPKRAPAPRGVVVTGPHDTADGDPLLGPSVNEQLAYLTTKPRSADSAKARANIAAILKTTRAYYALRDAAEQDPQLERFVPDEGVQIVLDGFHFRDGSGRVLLDRMS